jgi:hypothetical protein
MRVDLLLALLAGIVAGRCQIAPQGDAGNPHAATALATPTEVGLLVERVSTNRECGGVCSAWIC